MRRRFNFTGRKKIRQGSVQLSIVEDENLVPSFYVDFDLDEYGFPEDADVWVEAYDRNHVNRFYCGKVTEPKTPSNSTLASFRGVSPYYFRVKVSDPHARAKLLGLAKGINPIGQDEEKSPARSLLRVGMMDLGNRVWRLDFFESEHPILYINNRIEAGISMARLDPYFQSVVLPEVFEKILRHILMQLDYWPSGDPDEEDAWKESWLTFAETIPGTDDLPDTEDPSDDEIDLWIDTAVTAFCSEIKALRKVRIALKELE